MLLKGAIKLSLDFLNRLGPCKLGTPLLLFVGRFLICWGIAVLAGRRLPNLFSTVMRSHHQGRGTLPCENAYLRSKHKLISSNENTECRENKEEEARVAPTQGSEIFGGKTRAQGELRFARLPPRCREVRSNYPGS